MELAQELGLKLAIGHNYRTFPGNRALKDLTERGAIGRVCRVLWMWLEARPESYYDRDVWRTTWEHAGGGVLMNQASHDIDLLCWMMGDPTEVSAMVANRIHRAEVEDTVIANIRFASGAYCNLQLSTCDRRLNYRQISGEAGTIVYQDDKNANSQVPGVFRLGLFERPMPSFVAECCEPVGQPRVEWEDVPVGTDNPDLLESFVSAVIDGGEAITDGVTARRSLELINAMVLSGVRKEVVSMPLDRGRYDDLMEELSSGKTKVCRHPR